MPSSLIYYIFRSYFASHFIHFVQEICTPFKTNGCQPAARWNGSPTGVFPLLHLCEQCPVHLLCIIRWQWDAGSSQLDGALLECLPEP